MDLAALYCPPPTAKMSSDGASAPYALRYVSTHSRKVAKLVIYGSHLRPTDTLPADAIRAYTTLWRTNPDMAAQTFAHLSNRQRYPEAGEQVRKTYIESIQGDDAARLFEDSLDPEWEGESCLSLISAPPW